jgi:hypothetical protein
MIKQNIESGFRLCRYLYHLNKPKNYLFLINAVKKLL